MEIVKRCPYCVKCVKCSRIYLLIEVEDSCPHCNGALLPDLRGHLYVNPIKGVYHCVRCNSSGKLDPDELLVGGSPSKATKMREIDLFTFNILTEDSLKIMNYCLPRLGGNKDKVMQYVRWSPVLPKRAIFPLWSEGKVQCINARTILKDHTPKYRTYGPKSKFIYRLDEVESWAVLTEGPFDALNTPHGVCTFGCSISDVQIYMLLSKYLHIYVALDPEAKREQEKLIERLEKSIIVYPIDLPEGEDPASLGFKKMERILYEYNVKRFWEE
jgi:DNA-directed RNA polymerase subunit RPC12/RpoP